MAKKQYLEKTFRQKTLDLIRIISGITDEYTRRGYTLTVRQCYYQLVAGGYIPNTQNSYSNVAKVINDGRMAGLIDWDAIEDRTRFARTLNHWENTRDMLHAAAQQYKVDKRKDQPVYLEAWIEKDALIGIVEKAANVFDIPCFSARGYPSISALREAARRLILENHRERRIILYAGDHDPTGLDIPRSIAETLATFGADVEVMRIGLTRQQIQEVNAPPNPAKETDKRFANYAQQHGRACWELDALPPEILENLYLDYFIKFTDENLFLAAQKQEVQGQVELLNACYNWEAIQQYITTE